MNHVLQSVDAQVALNALSASQLKLAHDVRRRAEAFARQHDYSPDLRDMCAVASSSLELALCRAGADARLTAGRFGGHGHFWVDVYGGEDEPVQIVDLTATQFDEIFSEPLPPVLVTRYVDEMGNWYDRIQGVRGRDVINPEARSDVRRFDARTQAWLMRRSR